MDSILPIIAGGFLLIGTGLGLWITYNYRQISKEKQAEIQSLNEEIDKVVKRNEELNINILTISSEVKCITTELNTITSQIKSITQETKSISNKNKELSDKNLLLAEQTIKLAETIKNLQTGGDASYVYFFWGNIDENYIGATIRNDFDFPQYINEIILVDLHKLQNCKEYGIAKDGSTSIDHDCFLAARIKIGGREVNPKDEVLVDELKIPKSEVKGNYLLFIDSRNRRYVQKVFVSQNYENGAYLFGNRVIQNEKILKDNFGTPGLDFSQINWEQIKEKEYVFVKE